MVYSPRIGPDGAFIREFDEVRKRVRSLETRPAGNIVIRDSITTTDPETGADTIFGLLPDGTYGFEPFVGDTTPPPVATVPLVAVQPGVLTINWNGAFVGSAIMPRDFKYLNAIGYRYINGVEDYRTVVGVVRSPDEPLWVTTDTIPVGETWKIAFESVDYTGNLSEESERSSLITMESVVSDVGVTEALQELAERDAEIEQAAVETQAAAAAAQAAADAIVASGSNLVINGDFDLPIKSPLTGWPVTTLATVEANAAARSAGQLMRLAPTSTVALAASDWVDSAKGKVYYMEMWVRLGAAVVTATGTIKFRLTIKKVDGTEETVTASNAENITLAGLSTTSYTKLTAKYTITQDAVKVRIGPRGDGTGNIYFVDNFKALDVTAAESAQVAADQAANAATQAATAAGNAQTAANSKNRNWYQTTAPAGIAHRDGDVWFDTDDQNRMHLWNATTNTWVDFRDKAIDAASEVASGAMTAANGKNTNYYESVAPTDNPPGKLKKGDNWFDTANNYRLNTWTGTAWQTTQDAIAAKLVAQSKGVTLTQSFAPAVEFRQAQNLWIDISLGADQAVTKYWNATYVNADQSVGAWRPVADKGIKDTKAIADAKAEVIYSDTEPAAAKRLPQNLWIDTTGGINLHKRWNGTEWSIVADNRIAKATNDITNLTTTATTALETAQSKTRTFIQSVAPAAEFRLPENVWIDISQGEDKSVTKRWDATANSGAGAWIVISDVAIGNAVTTAAADAQAKADAAKNAAIAAAATTAQQKADAAKTAAIDEAAITAQSKADAAKSAAITSAAQTAQSKADTAKQEAIDAAAITAQLKANGAKQEAIDAAAITAQQKADAAKAAALEAAALDAESRASNAKTAAIQAAATDAAAKAATAKSEAIAAADESAQIKADAAVTAAIASQAYSNNASFDDWTGAAPNKFLVWNTGPVKDTSVKMRGAQSVRFDCTDTSQNGLNFNGILDHAPNLQYFTIEVQFYLASGTSLSGAAVLLDWVGMTGGNRAQVNLKDEVLTPQTGKWYTVVKTVKRPDAATGTWTVMDGYLMANYPSGASGSLAAKVIHFDWLNIRPASAEEILAFLSPADAQAKADAAKAAAIADAAGKLLGKNRTYYETTKPTGGTYIKGDVWIDIDGGNKIYVYNGSDFVAAQDTAIDKALYASFPSAVDSTAANKWLYTKYDKVLPSGSIPVYTDIVAFAGTSALVPGGADLVMNQGTNYVGMLRTIVNVAATKTISFTFNHDDGARIYVDGTSVYGYGSNGTGRSVSFSLTAGWHVIDFLWNELSGNDGIWGISPTIGSQVTSMYAPVSATATASMANAAMTSANGKNKVIYSNSDASGTQDTNGVMFIDGDTWFKRSTTSPFNIIAQWEYLNNAWASRKVDGLTIANIDAGTITVGKLTGQQLDADAINGKIITGATMQTHEAANTGIKLTPTEFAGWSNTTTKAFSLTSAGALTLKGAIQSGSTITGTTVTGSTINGGTIQTSDQPLTGVKITSTGITAYNAADEMTFKVDAATGLVEMPGLKANSIKGTMIEASTITADNMLISDWSNYWENSTFEDDVAGTAPRGLEAASYIRVASVGATGSTKSLEVDARNGSNSDVYGSMFAVQPGDQFYFNFDYKFLNAVGTGTIAIGFRRYSSAKVVQSNTAAGAAISTKPTAWTNSGELVYTIPASTYFVKPWFVFNNNGETTNKVHVDNIIVRRKHGGNLIVDGAINGHTITGATVQTHTGATTGIKLTPTEFAGYDGTNKNFSLTTGGVLTLKGAIQSGSTITGTTISGGTLQTSTTPLYGVKITSTGIIAYNANNEMTFKVDGASGLVEAPGLKGNSIIGDMIASDTIGVRQLLVTDLTEFAPPLGLSEKDWLLTGGMSVTTSSADPSGKRLNAFENTGTAWAYGPYIQVKPGDKIRSFANIYRSGATLTAVYMRHYWYNSSKVLLSPTYSGTATSADVPDISMVATVPADAAYVRFTLAVGAAGAGSGVHTGFYNITSRRQTAGELIVDGAIKSINIATEGLDAGVIKSGEIDTKILGAKSISVDKLTVSSTDNLIQNADFMGDMAKTWNTNAVMTLDAAGGRKSGTPAAKFAHVTGTARDVYNLPMNLPFDTDGAVYVSAWVKPSVAIAVGQIGVEVRYTTSTGSTVFRPILNATAIAANVWTRITGTAKATDTTVAIAAKMVIRSSAPTGTYWFDYVSATRASNGELIVDGTILTDHLKSGSIDASILTAGSIKSPMIASKSIEVDRLVISSTDNLIVESDFSNGGASWSTGTTSEVIAGAGRGGGAAFRFTGTTSTVARSNLNNRVTVDDDARFRCAMWVKSTIAMSTDRVRLKIRCFTTATASTEITAIKNSTAEGAIVAGEWVKISGISPALPANTIAVEFRLEVANSTTANYVDIDSVSATRAADGNLVVDGAINGKTITGALIQSSTGTTTGVKIDGLGIRAYNSASTSTTPSFNLDAVNGNMTATGIFQTSTTGKRVKVWDHGDDSGIAAVDMFPDTSAQHGALFSEVYNGVYYTRLMHFLEDVGNGPAITLFAEGSIHLQTQNNVASVEINQDGSLILDSSIIHIKGKTRTGHAGDDTFVYGTTAQTQTTAGTYNVVYGSPASSAKRYAQVTPDGVAAGGVSFVTQSMVAASFKILYTSPANNSTSFNYMSYWRD